MGAASPQTRKKREVRMTKVEKGSEIITTISEYENSVAMPDNERLTYLDTCGIVRLKDGNGNVKALEAHANRCSEYLRFGHEVDLAACGAYSPYDALKVCDTPEIFLKTGFEQSRAKLRRRETGRPQRTRRQRGFRPALLELGKSSSGHPSHLPQSEPDLPSHRL